MEKKQYQRGLSGCKWLAAQARFSLLFLCPAHRHQQHPCCYDLMVMFTAPQLWQPLFLLGISQAAENTCLMFIQPYIVSAMQMHARMKHICTIHNMYICTHCVHLYAYTRIYKCVYTEYTEQTFVSHGCVDTSVCT